MSLPALAAALASGELPLAHYLDELESRFAEREPEVLALVPEEGRFARLRREAQQLAERWPEPAARPPLYGVPVGVKDIFHVDGFPTRAGSHLPPAELAGPQAASVSALVAAGALILGKTVTTEFATFAPGPTHNPRRRGHTPGGSSSGSAAAVGACLSPLALGTQTIGSIGRPAAFCGVVGYKPSYGRIPVAGVIPLAPSLDHVGTFTSTVAGARLAATLLCRDWRAGAGPAARPTLGVPVGPYLERASTPGLAHFAAVCDRLSAAGYALREVAAFADFAAVEARHRTLFDGEAARVHTGWLARHRALYQAKTREILERGERISDGELEAARAALPSLRRELETAMEAAGVDLWIAPAAPGPAPAGLDSTGDPVMNLPWTQAGLPTLALPSGDVDGLPLGLQLAARYGDDEALLAWGQGLEGALAS